MAKRNLGKMGEGSLLAHLIEQGVDVSAPEFQGQLTEAASAAVGRVPQPEAQMDNVPEWYKERSRTIAGWGRLAVMLQVTTIRGLVGPLINVTLFLVDWYRTAEAIALFQPLVVAILMGGAAILTFTYLSLKKAELSYLLRNNKREVWSLRRLTEWITYVTAGADDKDWKPRYKSETELMYKSVSRKHFYFLLAIFILMLGESVVKVYHAAITPGTSMVNVVVGAVVAIIITIILLWSLESQIEGSYRAWKNSGDDQDMGDDFFVLQAERYSASVEAARVEARRLFLYQYAMQMLPSTSSTLTPTPELPPTVVYPPVTPPLPPILAANGDGDGDGQKDTEEIQTAPSLTMPLPGRGRAKR